MPGSLGWCQINWVIYKSRWTLERRTPATQAGVFMSCCVWLKRECGDRILQFNCNQLLIAFWVSNPYNETVKHEGL
jgi:hypothetical protein